MNLFLRLAVGLAALASSSLPALAQSVPDQHRIVPGQRIGRVYLGDSQKTVHRRLGKPDKTFKLPSGLTSDLWRSKTARSSATGRPHTLEVVYRRGVVVQVEATNPVFRTSDNLSAEVGPQGWLDTLSGEPRVTTYRYPNSRPTQSYYDWTRRGITLETLYDSAHDEDDVELPNTVIVHRAGVRVTPDPGGRLAR